MDRLLSWLCAMILAGGLAFAWDRHPPVHYVLPWWTGHMHLGLPDSLSSKLDDALKGEGVALQATKACRGQLDTQNAAIALQGRESAARMAAAEKGMSDARSVAESFRQASGKLSVFVPQGADELARWRSADQAVVGSLKP
jgi:roadblock/LC7 domain-containing protein